MKLNKEQKKYLRSLGHHKKTIIWVGQNGLTDNTLEEIKTALAHHEFIKLKIRASDREMRDELATSLCKKTSAELIQKTGNMIAIYRHNKKHPKIKLPDN